MTRGIFTAFNISGKACMDLILGHDMSLLHKQHYEDDRNEESKRNETCNKVLQPDMNQGP